MKCKQRGMIRGLFPVFSRDIALELVDRGYPIVDASPNKKNPNYTVFYFTMSEEVKKEFDDIVND